MRHAEEVYRFWFEEHGEKDWFAGSAAFDAAIAERFGQTHAALARGEGFSWRSEARGRLSEIIVLDQFSRQLFRNDARAFAQDPMALVLAQELVAQDLYLALTEAERMFAFLPYMHSESLVVHEEAVRLHERFASAEALEFEIKHRDTLMRFGRYPKRNAALGRQSTPEEQAYLDEIGDRAF